MFHKVRTAIGRSAGQPPAEAPPVLLRVPELDLPARLDMFRTALEKLAGTVYLAASHQDAAGYAEKLIAGRQAVVSESAFLARCGIRELKGAVAGYTNPEQLKQACAAAGVGITGADYALADTGTLVMLSSAEEARLISLLPPVHLAIVPRERLLTSLDELFTVLPDPAAVSSSMVLITGPSRTADIEQILVRGVHGPGEIHVVFV